jgi:abortive infection bacteriophage resistance protein
MEYAQFIKPPIPLAKQVDLLRRRGMQISDQNVAEQFLLHLNYYRFSGYALHFEIFKDRRRTHHFKSSTSFSKVIELYEFDSQLRALLFQYIEPVEVAFRATICYELSIKTGNPHWHLDQNRYKEGFDFSRLIEDCRREYDRSDEIFIQSHRLKYGKKSLPPAWMMSEILSIGLWSIIFKNLTAAEAKKSIALHFNTKPYFLESWIHSISVLRNLCAHHCRIWNRTFTIRPKLHSYQKSLIDNDKKVASLIVVLLHLLKTLNKNSEFENALIALLNAKPDIPRDKMGFTKEIMKGF